MEEKVHVHKYIKQMTWIDDQVQKKTREQLEKDRWTHTNR